MSNSENVFGVIHKDELYAFFRFKKALALTEAAFRSLKRKGLPVIKIGKRGFVSGEDAINFFRELTTDGSQSDKTI